MSLKWLLFGFCAGTFLMYLYFRLKKGNFEKLGESIIQRAEMENRRLLTERELIAKQQEYEHRQMLEKLTEQKKEKWGVKEEKIERQFAIIEKKSQEVEKKERELARIKEMTLQKEAEADLRLKESLTKMESLAGLTFHEAKKIVFDEVHKEIALECAALVAQRRIEAEESAERQAAVFITTAINRISFPTVSEVAVITVALPNAEMKGRVIGREGRNIRMLEQATGVNFVIDDTPNTVLISGFDPIRKEVARIALKELIQDGRIHPTRIEEAVAKAELRVEEEVKERGDEAAIRAQVTLHPQLALLLGKLYFRFSYGQNILAHSLEVSHLMGIMASELKLDSEKARKIGLLHDIGKAVSHEIEGSHALIGQQLALKYGESEDVANGIGCHHEEITPISLEGSLCQAADRISGGRPGARSESLELYIKRSAKLEQLARNFPGVEKAFALHAGKEVRILVEPEKFDDVQTLHLAREIAQKIEKELSYPGKIKVTVIREKRAVEYAS